MQASRGLTARVSAGLVPLEELYPGKRVIRKASHTATRFRVPLQHRTGCAFVNVGFSVQNILQSQLVDEEGRSKVLI